MIATSTSLCAAAESIDPPRAFAGNHSRRLAAGISVLLVDDHPGELRLLGEVLHRAGARVLLATDGIEGMRLARELHPSVILLDISLPPTNGFVVCQQVRADPATTRIPVLFLSGHTETETKLEGFAVGGQDYITKPFVEAEVLARVALHVDLASRLAGPDHGLPRRGDAPAWLTDAVARLQTHLADAPKLAELAQQVGTNPRRLNDAFRTHLGNTVYGFLRETRLKEAHRLLVETALPIQLVGERVGYPLAANFATAFRERFGVSPRQLRREPDDREPA
jgi:DNA-binding response OmpR family regulator